MAKGDRKTASCEGKFRFTSHPLAVKAAKRGDDKGRWAYACEYCGGFHVGRHMNRQNNRGLVRKRKQRIDEQIAGEE